jgi:hypothetical protein
MSLARIAHVRLAMNGLYWYVAIPAARRALPSEHAAVGGSLRIGSVIIIVWLIIGAIAAGQRHYYSSSDPNCARAGTIIVTILAGPLNYTGVNPKISCKAPRPSR